MATKAEKELALGVLFKGRMDSTFHRAVQAVKTGLGGLMDPKTQSRQKRVQASLKQTGNEMAQVGKQLSRVHGGFQRLTAAMKVTFAYGIAATGIWQVVNAFKEGIVAIFDYHQALKNLQAITGATNAEISAMGKRISEVASTTKFSVSEVADSMVLLGQAGFTASESLDAIQAVADLATGTLTDLSTTADLLTTAIRAFGLEASDSARVSDVFASAVNRSKLTIDKIRIAFNYLGPVANKAGLSLEETAAGAMVLANAGLRGSTIGTGLRNVLSRLIAPNTKLRAAFAAAGADMDRLNPRLSDMETIILELSKVVPNAQRAFELFGLRGASAVSSLTEAGVSGYRRMLEETYKVGTASKMAETQMEGLSVMAKNLKDRMGLLAITLGEGGIAGAFKALLVVLRPLVSALTYLANTVIGKLIVGISALSLALIGLRISFSYVGLQMGAWIAGGGRTIATMTKLVERVGFLNASLLVLDKGFKRLWRGLVANPIIAIIAAISAVAVVSITWIRHLNQITNKLEEQIVTARKTESSLEGYKQALEKAKEGSLAYRATMERLLNDFPKLTNSVDRATMTFKDHGKALDDLIASNLDEQMKLLIELIDEYGKKIERAKIFQYTWDRFTDELVRQRNIIRTILGPFGILITSFERWVQAFKDARPVFIKVFELVRNRISYLANEYGTSSEKIVQYTEEQQAKIQELAESMSRYGIDFSSSIDSIKNKVIEIGNTGEEEAQKLAEGIKAVLTETRRAEFIQATAAEKLANEWAEAYQKVGETHKQFVFDQYESFKKQTRLAVERIDNEKELAVELEKIRQDHLKAIIDRTGIEIDLAKRTDEWILENLDLRVSAVISKHDRMNTELKKRYQEDIKNRGNTYKEWIDITDKFLSESGEIQKSKTKELVALEEARLRLVMKINKEALDNTENFYRVRTELAERSHEEVLREYEETMSESMNMLERLTEVSEEDRANIRIRVTIEQLRRIGEENKRHYDEMMSLAQESHDNLKSLRTAELREQGADVEEINKAIERLDKDLFNTQKRLYNERVTAYRSMMDKLLAEEKRLSEAVAESERKQRRIREDTEGIVRDLRRQLMKEQEAFYDEAREADELYAKGYKEVQQGNWELAQDYLRRARDMYAGLGKEVVVGSGKTRKVVVSEKKAIALAIAGVKKAGKLLAESEEKLREGLKGRLQAVRTEYESLKQKVEEFKVKIEEISRTQLKTDPTPFLKAINKAMEALNKLRNAASQTIKIGAANKPISFGATGGASSGVAGIPIPSSPIASAPAPVVSPSSNINISSIPINIAPIQKSLENLVKVDKTVKPVDIKVEKKEHRLYGDYQTIESLVQNLRRAGLVSTK